MWIRFVFGLINDTFEILTYADCFAQVGRLTQYGVIRVEKLGYSYSTMVQSHKYGHCTGGAKESSLKVLIKSFFVCSDW